MKRNDFKTSTKERNKQIEYKKRQNPGNREKNCQQKNSTQIQDIKKKGNDKTAKIEI